MNSEIFNVDCITSKSNSTIVKIAKLMNKKYRKEEKLFILDGTKLFLEACTFGATIKYIILDNSSEFSEEIIRNIALKQKEGAQVICVNDAVFSKVTEENSPQGIVTVCEFLSIHRYCSNVENVLTNERVIALESVRDPGNLGAILRNAAAFGIDRIIMSADCADIYSQKVLRASMGAIFKVKIDSVPELTLSLSQLKNSRRIIATTLKENSLKLGKDEIKSSDIFVIGNEGHGISEEIIGISNETMFIPMCENTESLNAAIATAILMWEIYKL